MKMRSFETQLYDTSTQMCQGRRRVKKTSKYLKYVEAIVIITIANTAFCTGRSSNAIEIDALGRQFQIGMLYDRRNDALVIGKTLWSSSSLSKTKKIPLPSSHFTVSAASTKAEVVNTFDASAEITLSLLFGLIKLPLVSTEYSKRESKFQEVTRVSLHSLSTTYYEEISMDHLSNMEYPEVFKDNLATDVVVGITYGFRSVFLFERKVFHATKEEKERSSRLVRGLLRKLAPAIGGNALGDNARRFRCKIYSDLDIRNKPSTYNEAIKLVKVLPKLTANQSLNAKPMYVYLLPLDKLAKNQTVITVKSISIELIEKAKKKMTDVEELEILADDAIASLTQPAYEIVRQRLSEFRPLIRQYKARLESTIRSILPEVRGGKTEEHELQSTLNGMNSSPFNTNSVRTWLSHIDSIKNILKAHLNNLGPRVSFIRSDKLINFFIDSKVKYIFCIFLKIFPEKDVFLKKLKRYMSNPNNMGSEKWNVPLGPWWFNNITLAWTIKKNIKDVARLTSMNKANSSIQFLVVNEPLESNDKTRGGATWGSTTYLYTTRHGLDQGRIRFQVPSEPGAPVLKHATSKLVTLTWSPPAAGSEHIVKYSVYYMIFNKLCLLIPELHDNFQVIENLQGLDKKDTLSVAKELENENSTFLTELRRNCSRWEKLENQQSTEETIVTNLKANTSYVFYIEAICQFGVCARSKWSARIQLNQAITKFSDKKCLEDIFEQWRNQFGTCKILKVSDMRTLNKRLMNIDRVLGLDQREGIVSFTAVSHYVIEIISMV